MSSSKDTQKSAEKKEEPVATETFEERLASFTKWPHSGSLHPLYMAAAGFIFDNDNDEHPDRVTCNSCDWSTHTWEKGEDPRAGHLLTQPDCPFVKAYCIAPFNFKHISSKDVKETKIDTRLQCKRCKEVFESGNKLHTHVKQMKHFSTK